MIWRVYGAVEVGATPCTPWSREHRRADLLRHAQRQTRAPGKSEVPLQCLHKNVVPVARAQRDSNQSQAIARIEMDFGWEAAMAASMVSFG